MRIEEEILKNSCKCGNNIVKVGYEDGTHIVTAMICKNCGEDVR